MVQIIPRQPSFSDKIGQAFGNLGQSLAKEIPEHFYQKEQISQENEAVKNLIGKDISGIKNLQMRQKFVDMALDAANQEQRGVSEYNKLSKLQREKFALEKENQTAKLSGQSLEDQNNYNTIKQYYGEDAANIYKASTEGGKTAIMNRLLENIQRGQKPNEILFPKENREVDLISSDLKEKQIGKIIDYDKGLTPAERSRRQENRYKSNLPLFQDSLTKKQSHEAEKENLNILQELSPQIGAIERLNINPLTGDLIIPVAASAEAQRYVKTINDFTRNAKDSYGARVTNFDLTQFMKRLPTLANSEEGRRQIIDQLQLINDINITREKALHDVIEQHGGIRNIDFDRAEQLASKKSIKEIDNLKNHFKNIGRQLDKEYEKEIKNLKAIVPKDKVAVKKADGSTGYIPKDKVKSFLEVPGNELL